MRATALQPLLYDAPAAARAARLSYAARPQPGYRRRRVGRGFAYRDASGRRISDARELERIRALAIPPAWKDVKLAAAPRAKLQATGIDSAGRRQYRYHPDFRARQEAAKFQQLIRFAEKLPDLRLAMGERQTERSAP